MEQNAGKAKKNIVWYLAAVLFCLTLFTTWLVMGLYARYASGSAGEDSAQAAPFVFDFKETKKYINLTNIRKPGDSQEVSFLVTNERNGVISAVAEQYSITLQLNGSMPLKTTLTKDGAAPADGPSVSESTAVLPVSHTWTNAGSFDAQASGSHSYTLTVTWPADQNDMKYASGSAVAEAVLTVKGEQID